MNEALYVAAAAGLIVAFATLGLGLALVLVVKIAQWLGVK